MNTIQEAIRDKITKYSDACGMCTDTTRECDTCGITCVLEDLNELQKLENNPDAVRPAAHWISDSGVCFCGANPYCADSTDGDDGCCYWQQKEPATQSPADTEGIE